MSDNDAAAIEQAANLLDKARILLMGTEEDSAELDAVCVIEEVMEQIEALIR